MKYKPSFIPNQQADYYSRQSAEIHQLLISLLDTPVTAVHHIGSTAIHDALTSGIIDLLVIVPNLHAMTTLDEKRLNNAGFYRLHHSYEKKCVFSRFNDFKSLTENCRLHIVEQDSKKALRYLQSHAQLRLNHTAFDQFKQQLPVIPHAEYEHQKSIWFKAFIAN